MTPNLTSTIDGNDAQLVEQSLTGDCRAFGQIVARYQSLVCALAYSATGSRTRSEDLAQETFITAWRSLRELREPGRLRAWLCGIARHTIQGDIRRLGRQPAHRADTLDAEPDLASAEPTPTAQAVSNEEMAILWREVGRLPEIYREPLVLYYRDHQSVEHVAEALEISPDAVMQRLTRGRRQLQERMLAFVESTLERTNPGPQFSIQVVAALPVLIGAGPAAGLGTLLKGSSPAAKGGMIAAVLSVVAPFVGLFAAAGMSWAEIAQARTRDQRRFARRWALVLWGSVAGFIVTLTAVARATRNVRTTAQDWTATAPIVAVWFGFAVIAVTLIVVMIRANAALAGPSPAGGKPALPSFRVRVGQTAGFLVATFWVPLFMAWRSGDRGVAMAIAAGVFLIGALPLWLGHNRPLPPNAARWTGWYIGICGLLFVALLNWRLHVWLAPLYGGNVEHVLQVFPSALLHWLSVILIAWVAALVFVTRPGDQR